MNWIFPLTKWNWKWFSELKVDALDPKLEDMNIGIGKGKVWSKAIAVVVSPRAEVDSLIANTLVIDMDETDLPNALHHHYTINRYIGSGNTGSRSLSRARDRHQERRLCK